MIILVS